MLIGHGSAEMRNANQKRRKDIKKEERRDRHSDSHPANTPFLPLLEKVAHMFFLYGVLSLLNRT